MKTVGEIAIELSLLYREVMENKVGLFEKGEKGKIFQMIIDNLFEKYAQHLGYSHNQDGKHAFKSDVINAKNNIKKQKQKIYSNLYCDEYEIVSLFSPVSTELIGEGDGEIFTLNQINEFGLNPESY